MLQMYLNLLRTTFQPYSPSPPSFLGSSPIHPGVRTRNFFPSFSKAQPHLPKILDRDLLFVRKKTSQRNSLFMFGYTHVEEERERTCSRSHWSQNTSSSPWLHLRIRAATDVRQKDSMLGHIHDGTISSIIEQCNVYSRRCTWTKCKKTRQFSHRQPK